jgi:hypothetical protein
MQITPFHGYPDRVGKRANFCGTGNGPTSYTGGTSPTDKITVGVYQFYIDSIEGSSISVSGNYYALAQPSAGGVRANWFMRYYTASTGAEVGNNTNLSAEVFIVSGTGGFY